MEGRVIGIFREKFCFKNMRKLTFHRGRRTCKFERRNGYYFVGQKKESGTKLWIS